MLSRSIKLEGSTRKYKANLDAKLREEALSRKRRDGLMDVAMDILRGKQNIFGGRFAKEARRNKIILSHIVSLEEELNAGVEDPPASPSIVELLRTKKHQRDTSVPRNRKLETVNDLPSHQARFTIDPDADEAQPSVLPKLASSLNNSFGSRPVSPTRQVRVTRDDSFIRTGKMRVSRRTRVDAMKHKSADVLYHGGAVISGGYYSCLITAHKKDLLDFQKLGSARVALTCIDSPASLVNPTFSIRVPDTIRRFPRKLTGKIIVEFLRTSQVGDSETPTKKNALFLEQECSQRGAALLKSRDFDAQLELLLSRGGQFGAIGNYYTCVIHGYLENLSKLHLPVKARVVLTDIDSKAFSNNVLWVTVPNSLRVLLTPTAIGNAIFGALHVDGDGRDREIVFDPKKCELLAEYA